MATELHVNWSAAGGQNSGDGSSGNPYGSIGYAIAQQVIAQPDLATLAGLVIHVHDTANTGCPSNDNVIDLNAAGFTNPSTTNFVTIRAGDDKRPTGTLGPQLEVVQTGSGTQWGCNLTATVIDGFYFHHTGTANLNPQMLDGGASDSLRLRNCRFFPDARSFGSSTRIVRHNTNAEINNCVFVGGRSWIVPNGGSSSATLRNSNFIAPATAVAAGQIQYGASLAMFNCAVYGLDAVSTAVESGTTGSNNAIDAASPQGQAGIWSIETLTTAAFNNYGAGDYTLANGSALIDAGSSTAGQFTATDMYGTARSSPDIGFHEFVGSGGSASGAGVEVVASAPSGSAESITATITHTLRAKTGAARADETGITALVYKTVPSSAVAPNKVVTGVATDSNGALSIDVSDLGLAVNDEVWLILMRESDSLGGIRKVTPDYT